MEGQPVPGPAVSSPVMLLGQAPGVHEERVGHPFGWTAGKTLFQWFEGVGFDEATFRSRVYISAVCRCFPGKAVSAGKTGGDRVPNKDEIERCSRFLEREVAVLQPELLIPVGALAISQVLKFKRLADVIGRSHEIELFGHTMEAIPLPHPSGASTWFRSEPGKSLLVQALALLADQLPSLLNDSE
jgi:uracil-DNA glycosylase